MKRVLVIGSGGAGKSTFARRLGASLGLPVIHLDRIYWKAGWAETPKDEWQRQVEELCAGDSWVMDGNYSGTLAKRLAACDTVILLDLPRLVCLWRVLKRSLTAKQKGRLDMAEDCHERLNMEYMGFLWWVWNYPKHSRPKVQSRLAEQSEGKQIFVLSSSAEVEKFLADAG
jgi:adenylate kinase family enzyme